MIKYSLPIRIIHWVSAFILIGLFVLGFVMTDLDKTHPLKYKLYDIHKSFGLLIFIVLLLRIFYRIRNITPHMPETINKLETYISIIVHKILYIFTLVATVTGFMQGFLSGREIKFFGLIIPNIFTLDTSLAKIMNFIHVNIQLTFIFFVVLHILGFLKHLIINKTNLLSRII